VRIGEDAAGARGKNSSAQQTSQRGGLVRPVLSASRGGAEKFREWGGGYSNLSKGDERKGLRDEAS